jgi:hypothetical protein
MCNEVLLNVRVNDIPLKTLKKFFVPKRCAQKNFFTFSSSRLQNVKDKVNKKFLF